MESTTQYTLQLRIVGSDSKQGTSELEVLAHPSEHGQPFHGRFAQWEPIFEKICSWIGSSAFHRKAMHRTLTAGLPAHLINRETGSKHMFSADEIERLSLNPAGSELSTAA